MGQAHPLPHDRIVEQRRVERRGQHELEDALVAEVGLDQARPGFELRMSCQQRRLQRKKGRVGDVFRGEDERAGAGAGLLLLLLLDRR